NMYKRQVYGFIYSFTDWNGLRVNNFLGLQNYIRLFQEGEFLNAVWFTTKFAIVAVILLNIFGLALALIVTRNIKTNSLLRTIFFMPNLIGGLILGFIW
ncbi:sugar ABC transporter permease, partial [Enterobacter cloacae]|nr:sugar ABC transporter permease [Enterobacter cloacae]